MHQSTFMGLNTALRGVLAHQNALDVTGHNIANLNTEGYSRQRAEMVTAPAWSNSSAMSATTPGQLGTGVEVLRIERLRDQFIDANVRQQFGRQADSQALVEQLAQVEAAFQEPGDNGLKALMNKFWSSMDAVSSNPQSTSARQSFLAAAGALADGFNQVAADLAGVATQSDLRLNQTVTEVNSITQRISSLNTEIRNAVERGHQPNDLLDERDRLLDGLSKLINFTTTENALGEVTVTAFAPTTPTLLVDPASNPGFNNINRNSLDTAYVNGDLTSGRAFADQQLWNVGPAPQVGIIPGYLAQLDSLVSDFVTGINAAHTAGTDITGAAGTNLFGGATAATISLLIANPTLVAASNSAPGPAQPGNGRNFANMLDNVRTVAQAALGGQSWENFYTSVITSVGATTATAERDMSNADVLVEMATGRRDQVSGVSLDEEMSNMLRFQHAYNASARVLTSMDEALDTIINRMGRVGL
ncbi:MAG: flagellar hook-associated protein FlgK [Thermoleophilia bacterium]|nr:flagellar hook-associated protein FlgK [Thermoleophilia bacterium]